TGVFAAARCGRLLGQPGGVRQRVPRGEVRPPAAGVRRLADGARPAPADDGAALGPAHQVRLEPVRGRNLPGQRGSGVRARRAPGARLAARGVAPAGLVCGLATAASRLTRTRPTPTIPCGSKCTCPSFLAKGSPAHEAGPRTARLPGARRRGRLLLDL